MWLRGRVLARAFSSACPVSKACPAPTAAPIASTRPFNEIPGPVPQGPLGTFGDLLERISKSDVLKGHASYLREYGPILRQNFAGQTEVWCFDPAEMLKVMTKQGKYPWSGAVEVDLFKHYRASRKHPEVLTGVTQTWKTNRTILQKDLFNPPDAMSYVLSLDPAVRGISKAAPKFDRLSEMVGLSALDMFCSIMLGFCPNSAPAEVGDGTCLESDRAFVRNAIAAMDLVAVLSLDPVARQNVTAHPKYTEFCNLMDAVRAGVEIYLDRLAKGGITRINGISPYFERLVEREEMDRDMCIEAVKLFMFAGVDTTSVVLSWLILNLAQNPAVQEKLVAELKQVIGDGPMEVQHLSKLPYLTQCIRESHRLTPVGPGTIMRRLEEDVDLGGYLVPQKTKIFFLSHAIQNDPDLVENPSSFQPERWSKEAEEKRKGTPSQVIDHQMLAKPFGYGARMCIGARVAEVEIKTLVARLFRDWKISVKDPQEKYQVGQGGVFLKPLPFPRLKFEAR